MKKSILVFVIICSINILITSCKDSNKETNFEQTELGVEKADLAMNDAYVCPMGCEKDKTYEEEGECPVCKMALQKVKNEEEINSGDDESVEHEH